jgi:membrane-bound serine protease (ClpP class)
MISIPVMITLVIAGLVLLFLEIITPTFGLLAATAVAAMCMVVWQVFVSYGAFWGMTVLIALLVLIPVYLTALVKILPKTPLAGRLIMRNARMDRQGEAIPDAGSLDGLVGKTGTAETLLRPAGMVRIDGKRLSALAEGDLISEGQSVRVIRVSGSDVIVRVDAASKE